MTANQFRSALDRLKLSQLGAAKLFDVADRTARRWAEFGTTGPVSILLRLLVAGKITIEDVQNARR
jgi:hypothetical protein